MADEAPITIELNFDLESYRASLLEQRHANILAQGREARRLHEQGVVINPEDAPELYQLYRAAIHCGRYARQIVPADQLPKVFTWFGYDYLLIYPEPGPDGRAHRDVRVADLVTGDVLSDGLYGCSVMRQARRLSNLKQVWRTA